MILLILLAMLLFFFYKESEKGKISYNDPIVRISIRGAQLRCLHCASIEFERREVIAGLSLKKIVKWQLPIQSARSYSCARCGFVQQFLNPQEVVHIITVEKEFNS